MFNFITSFKKDVKNFITNAEARFKAIEQKLEHLLTPQEDTKADDAPAKVVEAVEAEVNKVD